MERIGFIGAYDKIDLMIYVAKILTQLGKKILILDTTQKQKSRYIVPAINPTLSYITEFEEIDIAIGFNEIETVKDYLGTEQMMYDYVLIDIDSKDGIEGTNLGIVDKTYFVTAFDLYSLKKGIGILENLKNPLKLKKIFFTRTAYTEDDEYLEFLALGKKIVWDEDIIYFPIETGDESAIAENQRLGKIKFKNISIDYKDGLASVASDIVSDLNKNIKNIIKNLE